MADLEWLEHNEYTKHQRRGAWGARALVLAFLAAVWGWPTLRSWQQVYYVLSADADSPMVGYVESYRDDYVGRRGASRSTASKLRVAIEYQGQTYTVRRKGYNFTRSRYERAKESRRVKVYVNHQNPAESVMSLGVPLETWVLNSLVALGELLLLGGALYCCWHYWRKDGCDVEG